MKKQAGIEKIRQMRYTVNVVVDFTGRGESVSAKRVVTTKKDKEVYL